jgi:5'-nucleotidase
LRDLGRQRFALDGTPTDCVLVAVHKILQKRPPDLVLSGVNDGGNLGEDVTYSGTVAAAMEAALLGLRAVALSQMRLPDNKPRFTVAERHAAEVLRKLAAVSWNRSALMNVNFPPCAPEEVSGLVACRQGSREQGTEVHEGHDPGGRPYLWIGSFLSDLTRDKNTDLAAVAAKSIAVTPLHLDLTHKASLKALAQALT